MPTTRRSARLASSQDSSSPAKESSPRTAAGSKRKSETGSSPAPKRGKKDDAPKEQKTIEETMDVDQPEQSAPPTETKPSQQSEQSTAKQEQSAPQDVGDVSVKESETKSKEEPASQTSQSIQSSGSEPAVKQSDKSEQQAPTDPKNESSQPDQGPGINVESSTQENPPQEAQKDTEQPAQEPDKHLDDRATDQQAGETIPKSQDADSKQSVQQATEQPSTNGTAIESHARDAETPSSILEKGIIYFFFRGRVNIDNPSNVQDIARSHLVLRPLPHGAKLGDGPIGPSSNKCRLLALPKKVLPTSGRDRFMTFVEKSHTSFPELKKSFLPADDYDTQTAGVRHTPAAKPIAEGVYAITTTGRDSHLAYMLTIPSELGDVQKDIGLREQGSFIVSCKNPQFPGPSYASLPQSPDYPKEILDEFRSLRWMPLQPKHLDYENTQFLLIGESGGIEKALDVPDNEQDKKEDSPKTEMERLEGEDEIRIKHLKGDDAIFADLGISKKEYSQVPTTWDE